MSTGKASITRKSTTNTKGVPAAPAQAAPTDMVTANMIAGGRDGKGPAEVPQDTRTINMSTPEYVAYQKAAEEAAYPAKKAKEDADFKAAAEAAALVPPVETAIEALPEEGRTAINATNEAIKKTQEAKRRGFGFTKAIATSPFGLTNPATTSGGKTLLGQ